MPESCQSDQLWKYLYHAVSVKWSLSACYIRCPKVHMVLFVFLQSWTQTCGERTFSWLSLLMLDSPGLRSSCQNSLTNLSVSSASPPLLLSNLAFRLQDFKAILRCLLQNEPGKSTSRQSLGTRWCPEVSLIVPMINLCTNIIVIIVTTLYVTLCSLDKFTGPDPGPVSRTVDCESVSSKQLLLLLKGKTSAAMQQVDTLSHLIIKSNFLSSGQVNHWPTYNLPPQSEVHHKSAQQRHVACESVQFQKSEQNPLVSEDDIRPDEQQWVLTVNQWKGQQSFPGHQNWCTKWI